ncbi:hypothetical protein [Agrobacterium rubi]|uniref:Uncharacterized protein n=1 Tax=Agrobacterium rubi TaxID=28099 RepID=A0AAE7UQC3_9HYPH|nr:hypothetical protein [Agrobacterium rubi]NTE86198.1 hypothetical protein [Agrobacterium rubi]NTF02129.1 hypothetical protein [Agrobacterium rubi]NTF36373.1 hypothetical protein [Agrobacterium rubi]OCJ44351.1 hypothetical protein A6U92_18180 [Agrobacterium rubi]QTG01449.1 hypothetical protein G6M88_14100 [Agrobacterium rubi]
MKTTILFKEDRFIRPDVERRPRKIGANDNFRSLEFEIEGQERDWRALCLITVLVGAFAAFIFLPLW